MIEGLDEYFRRWTLFNSVAGSLFIIAGLMFQLDTQVFLIGIAFFIVGIRFALYDMEQRSVIQMRGRQIVKEIPSLKWKAIGMIIIPSLAASIGAYYFLGKSYASSMSILLGVYCLLTILLNKHTLPYFKALETMG